MNGNTLKQTPTNLSPHQMLALQGRLHQRTLELAAVKRQLQRGVSRRKKVEAALKKSGERHRRLLLESQQLQEGLRRLTHELLSTHEEERKKFSRKVQDEIAQTLLGINVHLLSLRRGAGATDKGLKNEIANTQRLVIRSARSMRSAARDFDRS